MKAYAALIALVVSLLTPARPGRPRGRRHGRDRGRLDRPGHRGGHRGRLHAVPARATLERRRAGMEAISSGGEHSCRLPGDGSLLCWGRNSYGQLGDGKVGHPDADPAAGHPGQARGGACRPAAAPPAASRRTSGSSAGASTTAARSATAPPSRAPGRSWSPSPSSWTSVNASWFNTCGITQQTQLYCWGDNAAGQIGDGGKAKLSAPSRRWSRRARTGRRSPSAAASSARTKKNGALCCWGGNLFGQLGHGSYAGKTKPARVGTSSSWAEVSTSWTHTCARNTSGGGLLLGPQHLRAVGNGNVTTTPTPRRSWATSRPSTSRPPRAPPARSTTRRGAVLGQQRLRRHR